VNPATDISVVEMATERCRRWNSVDVGVVLGEVVIVTIDKGDVHTWQA